MTAKFQRNFVICKVIFTFSIKSQKFSLGLWGRFLPGNNARERKEKKWEDEGSNGFKLPFLLASCFHTKICNKKCTLYTISNCIFMKRYFKKNQPAN